MRKMILFSFLACLFLLTACGVTPMLNLPADKAELTRKDIVPDNALTGTWFNAKDGNTLTIAPRKEKDRVFLEILIQDKLNHTKDNGNPLPILGLPVKYEKNEDQFYILVADMGKIRKMAGTSEKFVWMTRPYFFLVRPLILPDGKLEVSFVHWMKKENGKDIAADPAVKLQGNLVINTSEELVRLIGEKKYILTEPMLFERKK